MELANTKYGPISGVKQNGYTVFKGVPYAKAPIGDLRFRAPRAIDPWDGVYQADTFKNKCLQSELPKEISFYIKEFYSIF